MEAITGLALETIVPDANKVSSDHGMSALQNGEYILVWRESGSVIKAQIFRPDGKPKAAAFDVSLSANDENRPDVTTLEDGSFVVTYTALQSSTNASINAQRFSADGTRIGSELTVFHDPDDTSFDPEITALNDGGYVVVYNGLGRDDSYVSYHARVFDVDGTPRGNDFRVNQTTEGYQSFGDVAPLEDGGFAVTWRSREVDGSLYSVMLRLYNSDGTPRTYEAQVNQYWNNSQSDPSITVLENGNILLTWVSDGQDGSREGVYARIMNPDGNPIGDEFQVHTQTLDEQYAPELTALSDGGFVIVWTHVTSSETSSIMAQRFAAGGERIGEEVQLSKGSNDLDVRPKITELSDGVISVSWQDYDRTTYTGQLETKLFLTPALASDGDDVLSGTRFGDRLDGLSGNDKLTGHAGNDWLIGGIGSDILFGGSGRDHLKGGGGRDRLKGEGGNDRLEGGGGNDRLEGGAGKDRLIGGKGKDKLDGEGGNDRMTGGGGNDTFIFSSGNDVVTDFNAASTGERVDLRGVASIKGFNDLMNHHVSWVNGDAIIDDLNGNTLTLKSTTLNSLGADDFLF
ncbi:MULTISPECIES: calcium-binding protein [Leisingera]|jgi:hypothetical protein|uniref:calcium-binding protein n=1 Tax=Leisingera TaxID=191028 RepID=UPI0011522B71|nr:MULTISPECIES: calcium-binding protein [Leisingera]QDI77132.1 calcium-binding protein [Leisingera aquaemixtae]